MGVMRAITVAIVTLVTWGPALATTNTSGHPHRKQYVHETFGKKAYVGTAGRAAFGQALNRPREWGRGPGGFGKRLASGFATHVVKNSIEYGVAGIRHEDLHYHRSAQRGFGPRLRHALVSTVVTRKTTTGRRTVASGKISSAMGSGLVSRMWQPARLHTVSSGLATGGITLGAEAGMNVAREFWPHKRHSARRPVATRHS